MSRESQLKQRNNTGEMEIDLLELLAVLWSKIFIILLAGILLAVITYAGTKFLITPQYTSTTKIYVLSKQDENSSVTYSDLQVSSQLVGDYEELIKSRPVLEKVISALDLDMETSELRKKIAVQGASNTRFIDIRVEDEDPKMAQEIADAVREAAGTQIVDIMDANAVNTVEDASLPTAPSSPNVMKNTVIGGMLGVLIAVGIILLRHLLDDTVKTPDDVEKYLGLGVLASIPLEENAKAAKKSKKKGFAKSKR